MEIKIVLPFELPYLSVIIVASKKLIVMSEGTDEFSNMGDSTYQYNKNRVFFHASFQNFSNPESIIVLIKRLPIHTEIRLAVDLK